MEKETWACSIHKIFRILCFSSLLIISHVQQYAITTLSLSLHQTDKGADPIEAATKVG